MLACYFASSCCGRRAACFVILCCVTARPLPPLSYFSFSWLDYHLLLLFVYYLVRFRDVAAVIACRFIFGVKTMCYVDLVVSYLCFASCHVVGDTQFYHTVAQPYLFFLMYYYHVNFCLLS